MSSAVGEYSLMGISSENNLLLNGQMEPREHFHASLCRQYMSVSSVNYYSVFCLSMEFMRASQVSCPFVSRLCITVSCENNLFLYLKQL